MTTGELAPFSRFEVDVIPGGLEPFLAADEPIPIVPALVAHGFGRGHAPPLGMKAPETVDLAGVVVEFVVDLVIDGRLGVRLVFYRPAGSRTERHRKVAAQAPAVLRRYLERKRSEGSSHRMAHSEKVTDGNFNPRLRLAVPPGAQDEEAKDMRIFGGNRHPYMGDPTGALDLRQAGMVPGGDVQPVVVSAGPVV